MKLKGTLLVLFLLLANTIFAVAGDNAPRMSTDELNSRLGETDIAIVDVRTGADWDNSNQMIAGAIRGNPRALNLSELNKDQTIVLYCA